VTDAKTGERIPKGESGHLDSEQAEHLARKHYCKILDDDTDKGGGPDLADSAESADSATLEPADDLSEEATDGTD
jgi:hypothetical protein